MNAACIIILSVFPVTGGVPEKIEVPTQRNLITRIERYHETVPAADSTIHSKVYFRKLDGHPAPTPVFVFETPEQIKKKRCTRIYGE